MSELSRPPYSGLIQRDTQWRSRQATGFLLKKHFVMNQMQVSNLQPLCYMGGNVQRVTTHCIIIVHFLLFPTIKQALYKCNALNYNVNMSSNLPKWQSWHCELTYTNKTTTTATVSEKFKYNVSGQESKLFSKCTCWEYYTETVSTLCCPYSSRLNTALHIRHPVGHAGKVAVKHEEETHYSGCDRRQAPFNKFTPLKYPSYCLQK